MTQFLNLKQDPDNTDQPSSTDVHELDFDGQRRISSSERDGIKHDYTELSSPMESDTMENNSPHSVDSMRNWSSESVPNESSATKYDTRRSSLMESDTLGDDPSKTTQNDPIESENVENNTKKGDTGDWEMPGNTNTFRTSNDNRMEQITSSNFPSDVPKIDQLNLLPGDVISQDCREGISVNVDSGSSGGVDGSISDALHETDNNDGIITDIPSNLDALSDVRTGEKPGNDSSTNDMDIAGKNVEFYTSGHLLTGEELLAYCQWLHHQYGGRVGTGKEDKEQQTVIGLVSCQAFENYDVSLNVFRLPVLGNIVSETKFGIRKHIFFWRCSCIFAQIYRLDTRMLARVPPSTRSYKPRKFLYHLHLDEQNIFRYNI